MDGFLENSSKQIEKVGIIKPVSKPVCVDLKNSRIGDWMSFPKMTPRKMIKDDIVISSTWTAQRHDEH